MVPAVLIHRVVARLRFSSPSVTEGKMPLPEPGGLTHPRRFETPSG